jgi:hypothetical protein
MDTLNLELQFCNHDWYIRHHTGMPIFALSASQSVAAGVNARAEAAPMPKWDSAGDPAEVTQSAARSAAGWPNRRCCAERMQSCCMRRTVLANRPDHAAQRLLRQHARQAAGEIGNETVMTIVFSTAHGLCGAAKVSPTWTTRRSGSAKRGLCSRPQRETQQLDSHA